MYKYPDAVLMVFCKAPIPGQVKTRLFPSITAYEAAQLHCELTEKTLQTTSQHRLCEVVLWCSPTIDHPFFAMLAEKYSLALQLQQGADLGERMPHAFAQTLSHKHSAVIIGCDCPSLKADDIDEALFQLSHGKHCVLAPAEDGGYVLIGLNRPEPKLFDSIPWGTDKVMELTRSKLRMLNLDFHELKTQWDVDTADDLARYRDK